MKRIILLSVIFVLCAFWVNVIAKEPVERTAPAWGEIISKAEAEDFTQFFTVNVDGIQSHEFSAALMSDIMNQDGAVGVRFYHAVDNNRPTLVVVAVDKDGNDMLDGKIGDKSRPCPPWCGYTDENMPPAGQLISRDEAERLTKHFSHDVNGIRAHLFSVALLKSIATQPEAVALRLYYGVYENRTALVAIAVDKNGNDILDGKIGDKSRPCPPWCGYSVMAMGNTVD